MKSNGFPTDICRFCRCAVTEEFFSIPYKYLYPKNIIYIYINTYVYIHIHMYIIYIYVYHIHMHTFVQDKWRSFQSGHWAVAVLDEIQLISDDQRGSAWTRALLGISAEQLHICGANEPKSLERSGETARWNQRSGLALDQVRSHPEVGDVGDVKKNKTPNKAKDLGPNSAWKYCEYSNTFFICKGTMRAIVGIGGPHVYPAKN